MRPSEIYALDDIKAASCVDAGDGVLSDIFGSSLIEAIDLVYDNASLKKAERLKVHTKLWLDIDSGDRSAEVVALSLDGKFFGLHYGAGRGQRDATEFFVTDHLVFQEAFEFLKSFMKHEPFFSLTEDDHLPDFCGSYSALARDGDAIALASREHVSGEGELLFDRTAFNEAFRSLVWSIPGIENLAPSHPDVRGPYAKALLAGIPERLLPVIVDEDQEGKTILSVVFSTEDTSYGILVNYNKPWGPWRNRADFTLLRNPGTELADRYRQSLEERITPKP